MNRFNQGRGHRSFLSHALGQGREWLRGVDHFFRSYGPSIKKVAQLAAPLLAPENPALAAGVAVLGQGADNYAQLRSQLGGD